MRLTSLCSDPKGERQDGRICLNASDGGKSTPVVWGGSSNESYPANVMRKFIVTRGV
jgi:hypothetical protein